ncbi:NACHT, LRR and PYD domains-containing protein 12-like [Erythrolamprus reginae]|uniref:NACHT, LRR and PYD domains-containing protein 12-like n=1 Tax=Erythrolamprus reginae TaxID=121349 RepID=UPI00396CC41C
MDKIVKEELYRAMQELNEKQLKMFKYMLDCIKYNGKPKIPESSLDKADEQDVAKLLIQYYVEDALKVCIEVLKKCNINDVAKKLEETQQKDVDGQPLPDSSDYRNYIKNKFATMKDPNAVLGEYVSLNQRYSKLIIIDYHPSKEERENEILAMGRKHLEIISKRAESSTSIETLFNPDKYGLIPQVVVLQGAAGIGKTIMAKKIILDWASQLLYQDKFNYVFYICCRKMNVQAESQISIADIVSEEWPQCHKSKNVIQNILKNEDKLLFIIDGFDEFRYSFDLSENYFCLDPWKKEPVGILLRSLFQKKILPKSSLIITTRPIALEKLHECLERPRNVEILGFSTKEREEYFYKFFENEDQASQALRFVKQNDTLFTMCVIPLVSWIICTVIKEELEKGKDLQKTPYTLTAIYMLYFSSLLTFHHKKSKQNVQSHVKDLCSLAEKGVWEQKTFFMEEEIKKQTLNQGDSLPLFLNQSIFKRDIGCIQTFSFIHLSFQEFFAALFYVLEEGDEQHSENLKKNLQTLLERHRSLRPDFAVGFRFLFGFLNEERMRELREIIGLEISPKNKEFLLNWVKINIKKSRNNFQLQKEMFSYLYETQDDNFIKDAICSITDIDYQSNSDMELMVLANCIQHCQNLKYLFVEGSAFVDHEETELFLPENEEWSLNERYMEDFFKELTKLKNLSILSFTGWSFTESCSRHLAEVFRKNQRLKDLQLFLKDTDERAMELLCDGLQHQDCKVETLALGEEIAKESIMRPLAEVFRENQRLKKLSLSVKNPDERAMEVLCEGLKHPQCTIEILELGLEIDNESTMRPLTEVFRENQRLRKLCLSFNKPDERAMEILCEGLKHPQCKIEMLELDGDIAKESTMRHLTEVFRENQTLRELFLSLKNPDERAMKVLCEGLKHPQCPIERLMLGGEIDNESTMRPLTEALRENQRLRNLSLSFKNPDERAMEVFCEGLKHPQCTIETLELDGQIAKESTMRHLTEVFRENQTLRELFLSLKNPDERAIKVLCEGLKHPQCPIEMLVLDGEIAKESTMRPLTEVLRVNQRLRSLSLSFKNPDERAMEVLCEGLKHPQCTIELLDLDGEIAKESTLKHLTEVFRKNKTLREVLLSLKNPDERAMKVLCEGLKHPQCSIEMLQLGGEIAKESIMRPLTEVFRENQRLRKLCLSFKNPDTRIMEVLSDGLKHPQCSIEMLQLNGKYIIQNGKWNAMDQTAVVESPASVEGGVKRAASFESLQSRKRHRPNYFQNS